MKNAEFTKLLEKKKLTQREISRKLKIDEALFSKYATGKIEPGVSRAINIAKIIGTPVEKLFPITA